MSEFMVKLSDLRDAAARMRQSHQTISQSLASVNNIITELSALGIAEHQLMDLGRPQLAPMTTWTDRLSQLSVRLDTTADDVEVAIHEEFRLFPHFDLSLLPDDDPLPADLTGTTPEITAAPELGIVYVSPANKRLFMRLQEQKLALDGDIDQRALLVAQREQAMGDLHATRSRALSQNPDLRAGVDPRIETLETEIASLDAQIATYDASIGELQSEVGTLNERLVRVQPTASADFELITTLENNPTNPHVVANTYDCVNHIVDKVPVPPNMALDAYMWNDLALENPEFGITVGDSPLEGAVIVLERDHSYADDVFGHLLYIESIEDGELWVTDNNNLEPIRFSDLTDELTGDNINYLYLPWHTRA